MVAKRPFPRERESVLLVSRKAPSGIESGIVGVGRMWITCDAEIIIRRILEDDRLPKSNMDD